MNRLRTFNSLNGRTLSCRISNQVPNKGQVLPVEVPLTLGLRQLQVMAKVYLSGWCAGTAGTNPQTPITALAGTSPRDPPLESGALTLCGLRFSGVGSGRTPPQSPLMK